MRIANVSRIGTLAALAATMIPTIASAEVRPAAATISSAPLAPVAPLYSGRAHAKVTEQSSIFAPIFGIIAAVVVVGGAAAAAVVISNNDNSGSPS